MRLAVITGLCLLACACSKADTARLRHDADATGHDLSAAVRTVTHDSDLKRAQADVGRTAADAQAAMRRATREGTVQARQAADKAKVEAHKAADEVRRLAAQAKGKPAG